MTSRQPLRSGLAFLALAAHNAEEAVFARSWALAHRERLAPFSRRDLAEIWAGSGFRVSLLVLTLVLLVLAMAAARAPRHGAAVHLLLGVLAAFAANALVPHVAAAIALRAYVPGVATAILLVVPVATWVYLSTLREGYATRPGCLAAGGAGVAVYAAVAGLIFSL